VTARQQAILGERCPGIYPVERRPVVHLIIGEARFFSRPAVSSCVPEDGGRRARPGGRHCGQRLGKGPVGRLAPQCPRTPTTGGIKHREACPEL
jgi:hypothetical protein